MNFEVLQAENLVNFEEGPIAAVIDLARDGHLSYYYFSEIFYLRGHHHTFQKGIIVVEVPDLAWLAQALAIGESHRTKVPGAVD